MGAQVIKTWVAGSLPELGELVWTLKSTSTPVLTDPYSHIQFFDPRAAAPCVFPFGCSKKILFKIVKFNNNKKNRTHLFPGSVPRNSVRKTIKTYTQLVFLHLELDLQSSI